ncbi:MAG: DUF4124 domain-containing protein [Desulfuromonadaceae bacterium]|nr:DUF4124 domain-containing protein [Desulfuromonadaceae bacterium]
MKRTMILPLLILCSAAVADAETYKWTDDQGVVSFTDDPALIPSRYRSKALKGEDNTSRNRTRELEEKRLRDELTIPDRLQSPPARPGMHQPLKGHPGGNQIDPTPPSMKQPIPEPLGDQPIATPQGMKQPKPVPLGVQPAPTPPGMRQPKPAPLGDQPTPTPLGMEQPTPAK